MKTNRMAIGRNALLALWLGLGLLLSGMARAVTVTASPAKCVSVNAGGQDWSKASRAVSSDDSSARSETDGTATDYLQCTNYGFTIPAGATINGITVYVERRSDHTSNGGSHDAAMRIVKGGAIGSTDLSTATAYTTRDVIEAHGGPNELWGAAWTAADINAANFGAAFRAIKSSTSGSSHRISVDHIRIAVDYTYSFPPGDYTVTASPTSCINVASIGSLAWSHPDRARASDNSRSSATTWDRGTTQTNYLQCTGFGFSLPSEAIVNGITVDFERRISSTSHASARDNAVRIVKNGVMGSANRASATSYTTSDTYGGHGGAKDLWDTTWTPADINASNFGAAISAVMTKTSFGSRRVELDHMRITVSFTVPSTVVNPSAFNAYDTGTSPAGAINGVLATRVAGQAFSFDIAALDSSHTALLTSYKQTVKVELLDASAGGTLDANDCNAAWTVIQTLPDQKFTGTGAGSGDDRTITGSGGRHRVTGVTEANAWRNVAVRVSYPASGSPSVIGCSTDHFAIRPDSFSGLAVTDGDWETAGTTRNLATIDATGGVVHKAGRPFTVGATAVNASSATTTNYAGTPIAVLGACAGTGCTTAFGAFSVGSAAVAGVIDSSTGNYDEVGAFSLQLQDQTFASVDVDDTAASCSGRYICSEAANVGRFVPDHFALSAREIINRADLPVPASTTTTADAAAGDTDLAVVALTGFAVGTGLRIPGGGAGGDSLYATVTAAASSTLTLNTPLLADLPSGSDVFADPGFTYMGEQMNAVFTLVAQAADGSTTGNYDGVLAKFVPTAAGNPLALGLVDNGATRTVFPMCGATPAHPCFTPGTATIGTFAAGVADDVTVPVTVYRGGTAAGPCAALDIGIAPVDADGVAMLDYDLDADATTGDDHTLVARTEVRYGRMRLGGGYGSELVPLPLSATAQYWRNAASCTTPCTCTSGSFVTSSNDSQTAFLASDVTFSNYRSNLAAGEVGVVTPPLSVVFTRGVGGFTLSAPGKGNDGSVDLTVTVPTYLPSNTARAVFGTYKSRLIYRRENY